jgi:lysine 6-dehydrogenase
LVGFADQEGDVVRIAVLGGCGDMGSRAVELLAATDDVDEVVILDRDPVRGSALAGGRVTFQRVDATNPAGVQRALQGCAAVANALGPFYRFEVPLARAALAAGVPYVSICDDHDAARPVLALNEQARDRGLPVLTGLGWTPGLTNLAARRAYDELGGLDAVRIFWAGASGDATGHAVVLHTLYAFDGQVPVVRDGLTAGVRAGTGIEDVAFPPPLGTVQTSYVGHPEPVTLPRFLPGLRRVELKGGLAERHLNVLGRAVSRAGLSRTHSRRERLTRALKPLLPTLEKIGPARAPSSAWRVDAAFRGERRSWWGVGRMRDLTGIPLAIGALLLGRGEVDRHGVFAAEADGVPHARLWELLADHDIHATPTAETE